MEEIKLELFENEGKYGWYLYDNRYHCDLESNYRWWNISDAKEHGDKMVQIILGIEEDWSEMGMDYKQPKL